MMLHRKAPSLGVAARAGQLRPAGNAAPPETAAVRPVAQPQEDPHAGGMHFAKPFNTSLWHQF